MTDGWGAAGDRPWFGTGADRGLALVFVVAGIIGLLVTGLALLSRPYRRLSAAYAEGASEPVPDPETSPVTGLTSIKMTAGYGTCDPSGTFHSPFARPFGSQVHVSPADRGFRHL